MLGNNNKTVYMMVGIPYSGKTTYIKNDPELSKLERVSSDDIVMSMCEGAGLSYDKGFKQFIKMASNMASNRADALMSYEKNFILDFTNMSKSSRKPWLLRARKNHYKVVAIVFPPESMSDEELQRRIEGRPEQKVSMSVIEDMRSRYEVPSQDEMIDEIIMVP